MTPSGRNASPTIRWRTDTKASWRRRSMRRTSRVVAAGRGSRSSLSTRSTWWCWRRNGDTAAATGGSRTSISARTIPRTAGFVMLGKTFKGLTDQLLRGRPPDSSSSRRTERASRCSCAPKSSWRSRSTGSRPARATPAGMALRFARVDPLPGLTSAADAADSVDTVRLLHQAGNFFFF